MLDNAKTNDLCVELRSRDLGHTIVYDVLVCQHGTLGELFDLDSLKSDYEDHIFCDVSSCEMFEYEMNKYSTLRLSDFFDDWDHQDAGSKIPCWLTGLILGYPIENTMSIYGGWVR